MTIQNSPNPEIYVADLAAYNAGKLRGEWIDANQDAENIQADIDEMLSGSPEPIASEWAIHAYEQFYGAEEYLGAHPNLDEVVETAELIAEHGELGGLVIYHLCGDLDEARRTLDEMYSGYYDSLADFAEELTESTYLIPDFLSGYIDYEKMGRDMDLSGDIFTITTDDNLIHIFWNH